MDDEKKRSKRRDRHEKDRKSDRKNRRRKSSENSNKESQNENLGQKYLEMDEDIKEKLKDLPEVVQFIERLQKVIEKQVKKIIKWKNKVKQLQGKSNRNISTQTVEFSSSNKDLPDQKDSEREKSLADDIREAAEQAMQSSGFVYEESSGLYYDYNSGYYYNAEYGLYYDGTSGTYLKYNQDTQTYDFHSQVAEAVLEKKPEKNNPKRKSSFKNDKKILKVNSFNMETLTSSFTNLNISNLHKLGLELSKQWPPCMRLIVESTDIPTIKPGTLFIITCDGGTLGREGEHSICLADVNVSKHHLKISYNTENSSYMIVDLGSRNGTWLNGKRIASSKQESEPVEVCHASKLQVGSTTLLCHIHEGTQTCGHCEPGLLLEEEKDPLPLTGNNRKNLTQKFKSELKRLKKQHGFLGGEQDKSKLADGYTDRAERRRVEIGSQNPYEKTEAASVDQSIKSENKGFKLLSKMGWKEGESLGKDGTGVKEPIKVSANVGTAGMGSSGNVVVPPTNVNNNSKQSIWKKTQERFEKLPTPNANIFTDEESED